MKQLLAKLLCPAKTKCKCSDLHLQYQLAMKWIQRNTLSRSGIRITHNCMIAYPEVSGYYIPTLLNWGERGLAIQYAEWLVSIQNSDGSWSDPEGKSPYTFDTGQILKGLAAIHPLLPGVEGAIQRGCDWLLTQVEPGGRIGTPDESAWGLPGGKKVPGSIHLYAIEPLRDAAKLFNEPRYDNAVEEALAYYLRQPNLVTFNTLSHFHAYVLEALIDLGCPDIAAQGMVEVERLQTKDGSVPAYSDTKWICSTGLMQYALIWYKLGNIEKADRAFSYACSLQNESGGFYGGYGRSATYFPDKEISWAVKYFLDAYYWHIRTAFDANINHFPATIEREEERFQILLKSVGTEENARILDAGCGKGRFAGLLVEYFPEAEIWGVDISDAMLACTPRSINTRQGSLLNLPFEDNYFDTVYSIEALEHSVNPKAAIRELTRVVKPGGIVIIIDKNLDCQGTLKIDPWEQWFRIQDVEAWLSEYCTDVQCSCLTRENTTEPEGLFVVWLGYRK